MSACPRQCAVRHRLVRAAAHSTPYNKHHIFQGGGGNNFLDIQANFRFEQKGHQPTNSKGMNMLENPMQSLQPIHFACFPIRKQEVPGSNSDDAIFLKSSQMGQGTILKDHEDFPFHS